MKTVILLLTLLSLNAFANEHYKCYRAQGYRGSQDVTLTLSTALFSKKITAAELITKIKGSFETTRSPFNEMAADHYEIDQDTMTAAADLKYKAIKKNSTSNDRSSYEIVLSESILNFEETGYAHYYASQCFWILDCHTVSHFFKCDKI